MPDAAEPAPDSLAAPTPAPDGTSEPAASARPPAAPPLLDLQRPLDEGRPADAPSGPANAPLPDQAATMPAELPAETASLPDETASLPDETASLPDGATEPPAEAASPPEAETAVAPLRAAVPTAATPTVPAATAAVRSHRATVTFALVARGGLVRAFHATRLLPGRAARSFAAWSRRPTGRLALSGATITAMLTAAVAAGALVIPATGASSGAGPADSPQPSPGGSPQANLPPGPVPPIITPDLTLPGNPSDPLRGWAEELAGRTQIPVIALLAYGYAELVVAATTPGCNLSWTTLAAIGRVESGHGSAGEATLSSDGRALPPIIGDPLDGQDGRMLIPDSDGGQLDQDTEYDRAVGPMQFIPQTWQLEAVDANGDGVADVHNIHDAALAAANYLCRDGRDLATAADWWAAIHSYNNVTVYADAVFAAANEYGQRSRGG